MSSQTTHYTLRTTLTPERTKLYEQIATLVAGHRVDDAYCALADNFAQAAAFLSSSPEEAEGIIRDCIPDLMRTIRDNWELVLEAKNNPAGGEQHHA